MPTELDLLKQELFARFDAIGNLVSPEAIRAIVADCLPSLSSDPAFVRKMRFGGGDGDPKLLGTKYYRWGLSLGDVEWLFDLQESLRGQAVPNRSGRFYEGPSETLRSTFTALSAAFYLPADQVREIDRRALDDLFPRLPLHMFPAADRDLAARGAWQETDAYRRAVRAMDTAESGYGSQLVGAQYVGDLWQAARAQSMLFALLDTFEMTAPTAYLPVEVDIPELLFVSESTANDSSNYSTVKTGSQRVQVDAKKFILHQMWSGEMEEDSIIPFVPFLRRQQQLSLAYYSDSLVLNGDTTNAGTGNINLDDANPADTKHYLAFDGIRHVGMVDNTNNQKDMAGAVTFAQLIKARQRMKDLGNMINVHWGKPTDPNDLVYCAEDATADAIALLDEVITWDKYQQTATVFTGETAKIGKNPLITCLACPQTEADGKVSTTAGNNTKGQVVLFNRRAFKVGWRRRVQTETFRQPYTDQTRIVTSMRLGLGRYSPTGAASGIEAADVIYNITV